jgi:hypothetical protein
MDLANLLNFHPLGFLKANMEVSYVYYYNILNLTLSNTSAGRNSYLE